MAKNSKKQKKTKSWQRARKAPKCPTCARTRGRDTKRHPQGNAKRRDEWSARAKPCQFCPKPKA